MHKTNGSLDFNLIFVCVSCLRPPTKTVSVSQIKTITYSIIPHLVNRMCTAHIVPYLYPPEPGRCPAKSAAATTTAHRK